MRYDVYAQNQGCPPRFVGSREKRKDAVALVEGLVDKRGVYTAYIATEKGNVTFRRSSEKFPVASNGYVVLVQRDHGYLQVQSGGIVREFYPNSDAAFDLIAKRHRHNASPTGAPWIIHHAISIREVNERTKGLKP